MDSLSIHGPRGASYIDRLQIDKHGDTHTCAHICTQSCLAWNPIEAGPNINYLFFSRGLVTVIRVRGFLESGAHGLMRKTGLSIELSRHTWSSLWLWKCMCVCTQVCGCDCCSFRLAAGRDTLWIWGLEADVRVETLPKLKGILHNCFLIVLLWWLMFVLLVEALLALVLAKAWAI